MGVVVIECLPVNKAGARNHTTLTIRLLNLAGYAIKYQLPMLRWIGDHPYHVSDANLKRCQREDQRSTNGYVLSDKPALAATEISTSAVNRADRRHENCST